MRSRAPWKCLPLLLGVLSTGCVATVRESALPRTVTERQLVALAIQRAAKAYAPSNLTGRRVHLNASALDAGDAAVVTHALGAKLEGAGAVLAPTPEASDVTVEVLGATGGLRVQTTRLGFPGLAVWGADGSLLHGPVADLLRAERLRAWALLRYRIYETTTGTDSPQAGDPIGLRGRASFRQRSPLGLGPFAEGGRALPDVFPQGVPSPPAPLPELHVGQVTRDALPAAAPTEDRVLPAEDRVLPAEDRVLPTPPPAAARPRRPAWIPRVQARVASVASVHSASAHWSLRFDVLALPRLPTGLAPLGPAIRGVAGTSGTPGLQVASRHFGSAVRATNDPAARAALDAHGAHVLTRVQTALAPQATIALELKLEDALYTLVLERLGETIEPSLLVHAREESEAVLLESAPLSNGQVELVFALPREGHALALWANVTVPEASGTPAGARHELAVAALGGELPDWVPFARPSSSGAAASSARVDLLARAVEGEAALAQAVALTGPPTLLSELSATPASDGWSLERAALALCLKAQQQVDAPAWLRGVLTRRVGAASTAWLQRSVERCADLAEFDALLRAENLRKLRSSQAAVRVRAQSWLEARACAIPGYRPLAAKAEREAAIRAREAQGQ